MLTPRQQPRRVARLRAAALGIAIAACFASSPRIAFAQQQDADTPLATLFDEASEAFAKKEFATAARKFEAAHRRAPRGQTAYNAALSWEAAGEQPRAADAFALALEDAALPAAAQTHATARLAALERGVMTLRLDAPEPAHVWIGYVENRQLPATLHVGPGAHPLIVRFDDGRTVRQEIEARAGGRVTLKIAPPAVQPVVAEPPRSPKPQRMPEAPAAHAAPPPANGGTQRVVGWIALGTAAAATATAAYLGVRGLDARDEFDASGNTNAGARSEAVAFRTWTNVAWVSAIVFGAAGVVLLVSAPAATATSMSRRGPKFVAGIGSVAGTF